VKLLRHDLHVLTGAYALGALEGPGRERFEHYLNHCQSCSNEVRGPHETATRLGGAAAGVPPAQMRERVLAAAARTRQLPPVTEARPMRRPIRRPLPQPRRTWMPRLAVGLAAAAMVAVIILGFALAGTQRRLSTATAQEKAVMGVLNARDARIFSASTTLGGSATVVVSRYLHQIVFTAADLPWLSGKMVYELWLMGPPKVRPAGLLAQPSGGTTPALLARGLVRGDRVGVTVEPAGGTQNPTTKPIVILTPS
jgi:hypothetical protein